MNGEGGPLRCGIPADKAPRQEARPRNLGNGWEGCYKRRGRSSTSRGQLGPAVTTDIGYQRSRNREAQPVENQQQNWRVRGQRCDNSIKGTLDR